MKTILQTNKFALWMEILTVFGLLFAGISLYCYKLPQVNATIDEPTTLWSTQYVVTHFNWETIEAARYPPLLYYLIGWVTRVFPEIDLDSRLFWGRLTLLPLYLGGALFLHQLVRRLYGKIPAIIALILYLFNPEILAHARLLKHDFLQAVATQVSVVTWYAYLKKPTGKRLLGGGLSLGIALLSKNYSLLLIPIYLLFTSFSIFVTPLSKIRLVRGVVGMVVVSLVVLHAGYFFRESGRIPDAWESQKFRFVANNQVTRPLLYLIPNAYLRGLDESAGISEGKYWGYLRGEYYENGRWDFFPTVFLIKTPLPLLILIFATILIWVGRKITTPPNLMPFLLLTVGTYFGYFMFFNTINNGLRYLLLIYPLFILSVTPLWQTVVSPIKLAVVRGGIVILLLWYIGGVVAIAPHYLAFANETIGGPKNLWKYVADSNIDWEQDNKFFAAYRKHHPGIIVNAPEPTVGLNAVNVNTLNLETRQNVHWIRKLHKEPIDRVGYTWLIFDIEPEEIGMTP